MAGKFRHGEKDFSFHSQGWGETTEHLAAKLLLELQPTD